MNLPVGIEDIKRASAAFLARPHGVFINGDWADATTGELIDIIDPASGGVIAQVQAAGAQDVDQAVRAARVAFDDGPWADLAAPERARFMMKLAEAVERAGAEIAYLETLDNGMPL
ncbi:MAG: aldehyde dehydrogenase family protein, partial [Alphaproteobacteria bacterium]|nr:aldehyde dehydrogenase family protein [Alphaproteobacteria bacterium]